jgi:hypothetical protein
MMEGPGRVTGLFLRLEPALWARVDVAQGESVSRHDASGAFPQGSRVDRDPDGAEIIDDEDGLARASFRPGYLGLNIFLYQNLQLRTLL